jgi:carboxypeptidase Q
MKHLLRLGAAIAACGLIALAGENVDLPVVHRIRTEAFENSHVMDHAFQLTDVAGARVAGSPQYQRAAEWAAKTLKGWGLEDATLEKWGTFGRSWSYSRFSAHMLEPQETPLLGVPLAWSPSTAGVVRGEVILAPMQTAEEAAKFKGRLKGKFVMMARPPELRLHLEPDAKRYTDADLARMAAAPEPGEVHERYDAERHRQQRNKLNRFLVEEGVLAAIAPGYSGDDGTIFVPPAGSREMSDPLPPPSVALARENYNRIARLLEKNIPVRLEMEIETELYNDVPGVNVVANLPGGARKDEIVMIGAHLDSWQPGTGATDNAAGCAVMMEVVRILTALRLKMDRTVRIALWDAEEQGLIGSSEYVKAHFADRETMALQPGHAKLSGYFNFDNGSGKIRGVYLQGNDMMRPVFAAWLAPFADLGAATVTIRNTGGTDHQSFDDVGLPGFQFIQDPLDYMTRTHHTNMDAYDRLQKADLMQAAAVIASVVYDAATRPEMLPRKPLPQPEQKKVESPKK